MRRRSGRRRTTTSTTSRSAASPAARRVWPRFRNDARRYPHPRVAIHPQVRVVVRPYGSVVPLGFLAFGSGMFLYAAFDAPWGKASEGHTIGLMLVAFVAPLEALAAVIPFLARDTMAGVALGLFTGSWLLTGLATIQAE